MNPLPRSQAEHRRDLYRSEPAVKALVALHKSRKRSDNVQLAARVRGKVQTGAAKRAVRVTSEPEKTGMYEKAACGLLDSQAFLARKRKPATVGRTGSLLSIPKDADPVERAKMRRWLAQADEISRRLNS